MDSFDARTVQPSQVLVVIHRGDSHSQLQIPMQRKQLRQARCL